MPDTPSIWFGLESESILTINVMLSLNTAIVIIIIIAPSPKIIENQIFMEKSWKLRFFLYPIELFPSVSTHQALPEKESFIKMCSLVFRSNTRTGRQNGQTNKPKSIGLVWPR